MTTSSVASMYCVGSCKFSDGTIGMLALLVMNVCKQREGERMGVGEREREIPSNQHLPRCAYDEVKIYLCVLSKLTLSCLVWLAIKTSLSCEQFYTL